MLLDIDQLDNKYKRETSRERSAAFLRLQELGLPDPTIYATAEDWQSALCAEPNCAVVSTHERARGSVPRRLLRECR